MSDRVEKSVKQGASVAVAGGVRLAFECFGSGAAPVALLIMGMGAQMVRWPAELCEALVEAGFQVIRFDNRDCGLSTHMNDAFVPDVGAALRSGRLEAVPYTLDDMAGDCVGLLDALDVPQAHIVGASMGGAIAQILAARFPKRVLSLTSIMSTSGNPLLPPPTPVAAKALLARLPQQRDRATIVADAVARQSVLTGPDYPADLQRLRATLELEYDRGFNPRGVARQLAAIVASGDRRALLRAIRAPAAVIHGAADPLVPPECGADVARHIGGARLHLVPGMGHELPPALAGYFAGIIAGAAGAG